MFYMIQNVTVIREEKNMTNYKIWMKMRWAGSVSKIGLRLIRVLVPRCKKYVGGIKERVNTQSMMKAMIVGM